MDSFLIFIFFEILYKILEISALLVFVFIRIISEKFLKIFLFYPKITKVFKLSLAALLLKNLSSNSFVTT